MNKPLRILSLGAGVQSSTLALMAEHGDIEPIDCAIFADTQSEPKAVMEWLDWLEKQVRYPIYRVTRGSLKNEQLSLKTSRKTGLTAVAPKIPAFVANPDGTQGMFGRKCTADFKIAPIERKIKELIGIKRFSKKNTLMVEQLIGISVDEAQREKPSRKREIRNIFPLLDLYMTRNDCLNWMQKHGYPEPPKSACTFCPFHSDAMWEEIKASPEWESVVHFERELQRLAKEDTVTRGVPYLHRSCVPIDQVAFKPKTNKKLHQLNLFGNECSGMCGV
jgi:3'-phosphoadenosine 5'-phosphosulfate sulfotransferase (PAPS reductase)/FAD synthetase